MNESDRAVLGRVLENLELLPEELDLLASEFVGRRFAPGELVIESGCPSDHLYVLVEGELEVLGIRGKEEILLRVLDGEQIFGELSFIDRGGRSSTVRARSPVRALVLDREALDDLAERSPHLESRFRDHLSQIAIRRLRTSTSEMLEEMSLRNRFGRFVMLLLVAFSIATLLTGFIEPVRQALPFYLLSLVGSGLIAILSLFSIRVVDEPLRYFGVNADRWQRQVVESLAIGGVLLCLSFLVQSPGVLLSGLVERFLEGFLFIYFFVSLIQEFVFRCVLQTALMKFLDDERGLQTILMQALIFAVTHTIYGAVLTGLTFVMGLFMGCLFNRHRSLIGVTILHFIMGSIAGGLGLVQE